MAYDILTKRMPEVAQEYTQALEALRAEEAVIILTNFRKTIYAARRNGNVAQLRRLHETLELQTPTLKCLPLRITANTLIPDLDRFIEDRQGGTSRNITAESRRSGFKR